MGTMRSALARVATTALVLVLAGCADAEAVQRAPLPAGRVGASIAVLASTGDVVVVNPDQGSVSLLDATTLEQRATIDVGGEPHALLELSSGAVAVTTYRGGELVIVDPETRMVVDRRAVCAGPWGLAETANGASILVACEWEGTALRVDPATLAATPIASGLSRPRAVAAVGDSVFVADFTGGSLHRVASDGTASVTSLVPAAAPYRPALTAMTANLATAMLPAFGRLHVAHELVNHDGNAAVEKVADDYGSVMDGNPKINPAVSALVPGADRAASYADPPVLYARYDGGARVFNGPAALAAFGDRYLLVSNLSTADVTVIDAEATSIDARVVGSFAVGAGPSGVALDALGKVAYVDNAFDGSVSRLDLGARFGADAPRHEAELTRVRALPARYSPAALAGRKLFHDAANPHLTPSAVIACSTCHPGGGDDGLVWFIHTSGIPLKRRRTPHLANAHTATAPFHWDGAFPSMTDLVRATVTQLMAGDGLLVEFESVQAYLDEIVAPPVPPSRDPAAVARGRASFVDPAVGCAGCHGGPDFTDDQAYAVLDPMSLHADDVFTMANTPALHGLFLRAPYFHDGRARDLRDLLTRPDAATHGDVSALEPGQIDDLIAYLESL
ncbi:surface antigen [Minicystis rosea]|nr:surface antigen [Minicystis rosea]